MINPLFLFWPILAILGLYSAFHRRVKWWPLLLWTTAYIAAYIALGVLRFNWYYPPIMPALALLTAEGIEAVAKSISFRPKPRFISVLLAVILCVLCLVPNIDWLIKSQRTEIDPHSSTYVEIGQWLEANTPPNSSVGMIEIGIIGFYSDRTVVDTMGLVSPDMVGHLGHWLQTLQFAVNYYWPDYVVGLEKTAWVNIVEQEWFKEAYMLETEILNSNDPVTPARIYSRRSGFPRQKFVLDEESKVQFDQAFILQKIELAEDQVLPGDKLHVQLTWEAITDIHTKYDLQFDLLNTSNQQSLILASALQPMQGGNPTTQWRQGDKIVDRHLLTVPSDIPTDSYQLRLIVTAKDGAVVMSDLKGNSIDDILVGPIQIDQEVVVVKEATFPITATFSDDISLEGFDLDETVSGDNLLISLYWKATAPLSKDYTVFVHLLSPEGELVAQHDSPPPSPTSSWIPGTQVIDMHRLTLPVEPTHYEIRVGLYDWPDLERAPIVASGCLDAANDVLLLGHVSFNSSQRPTNLSCPDVHWIVK